MYPSSRPEPSANRHLPIFEQQRSRLMGIAYRMLGSREQAQDVLQDAWLRWSATPLESVDTAQAWLTSTVTRLCVDSLRATRSERQAYSGPWLPAPWLEPDSAPAADARAELASDLSIALLVLLESLTPDERAAFLLHDVFDSDYAEVASVLGKTQAACRQLVHRARSHVRQRKTRFAVTPEASRALIQRFVEGMRTQDHAALLALFSQDALWTADGGGKAPAASKSLHGPRALSRLAAAVWRLYLQFRRFEEVDVNGAPGLVLRDAQGAALSVMGFETDGVHIHAVYSQLNPDKLRNL
ncbi:RNA polymerase sigma factor SigJ [Comamonas composti]|uniref:RNA polymerase sigma factor SigJ n=1 Tax=Comamonas composti TaxID=408558 RepID=UPI0003FF6C70|nr:RNA polymerase sigma factor SigJ [Comamonas composti]